MFRSIKHRFALVVAIMLILSVVSYLEVAYFVGRLSDTIDHAERSEQLGVRIHTLGRLLWEARFWQNEVTRDPNQEGEVRFRELLARMETDTTAAADDAEVLSPVLPEPAKQVGNILAMLESYRLGFDYLHRLHNRQQVFQANLVFNFWDLSRQIQRQGSLDLLRLVMEIDQTRRSYLELHAEHQYLALKADLARLERDWQALGTLSPEMNIRLANLRSNLDGERGLNLEIKLVGKRFEEITAQLTSTIEDLTSKAHRLSGIQHREAGALQESLPRVFLISGLAGVAVLLILMAYLANNIIKPVGELSRVARLVESGQRETRASSRGQDEMAGLIQSFNAMLDTIDDNNQRLIAYQSGLESLVAERTRELAASEGRLRGLVESARDGLLMIDGQERLDPLNPVCALLTGYQPGQAGRLLLSDIVHPEDWPVVQDHLRRMRPSPQPGLAAAPPLEFRLKRADGSWLEMEATFSPLGLASDKGEFLAVLRDISWRKRAEKVLRDSEERYRWLIEQAGVGHFVADGQSLRLVFLNRAFCEMFGVSLEHGLGLSLPQLLAPEEQERVRHDMEQRAKGEKLPDLVRYRVQRVDGSSFLAEIMVNLVDFHGRPALQGVLRDVTEQTRREQQRTRLGKLEAIGTLAGGIAHDFNNFLAGILGNLNLARLLSERGQDWRRALAAAETTTERAAQMTSQLLTFAKGGQPALEPVDIARLVNEAVDIALGKDPQVSCRRRFSPDLLAARADRAQIMQVLTNLLINARQAMSRGGEIVIGAENVSLGQANAVGLLPAGDYLRLTVADQGPGIAAEDLERIFDPFYTTKSGGTGLGLAITHSVITRHGGHVEVASEPGRGAIFTIYLPATDEWPPQTKLNRQELTTGQGRVLMVDDEEAIRTFTAEVLKVAGYQAATYPSFREGLEALRRARDEGRPFELVIFDLSVPGDINGAEAIRRAREIDPRIKAVVASGYSDLDLLADPAKYGFDAALRKPFTLTHLTQVLAEVSEGLAVPGLAGSGGAPCVSA